MSNSTTLESLKRRESEAIEELRIYTAKLSKVTDRLISIRNLIKQQEQQTND